MTLAILAPARDRDRRARRGSLLAHRERLGSLRRQALITGALAFGPLAVALVLFVQLMFVSAHDALLDGARWPSTARCSACGPTRLLSHRVMDDVDTLRAGPDGGRRGRARASTCSSAATTSSRRSRREVEAMVARLAAAEAQREEADAARRSLIAAVSHDLRTPVTALRLLADAVDDEIGDPETRREYVRRLGVHVRALGALIDDLFELTRIEAGEVDVDDAAGPDRRARRGDGRGDGARRAGRRHLRARRDRPGARARARPTPSASSACSSTSSRTRSATRPPTAA